jgi:ribonuclease Y
MGRTQPSEVHARVLIGIGVAIGAVAGVLLALLAVQTFGVTGVGKARRIRRQLLEDAERDAETVRREAELEARERAVKLRAEIDAELSDRRESVLKIEERVLAKEEEVERKLVELSRRDQGLADRETHLRQLQDELKQAKQAEQAELERIAAMTLQEAKAHLLDRGEELARHDLARRVRMLEEEARTESKRRARNLVADALQRVAASHAAETTVTVIELPSDDMKGRIIGREGRNIRHLEQITGVNLIVDDTPEAVSVSSFDPVRREVARLTLTKLIEDGRNHPARI